MAFFNKIIIDIELHYVEGIRECFENGINPNDFFHGSPLIDEMIIMYTRTPRFKECIKAFVDYGLKFEDPVLFAVLMDYSEMLEKLMILQPEIVNKRYSLKCTYTPLENVTLLPNTEVTWDSLPLGQIIIGMNLPSSGFLNQVRSSDLDRVRNAFYSLPGMILIFLILTSMGAYAQVSGRVADENNNPLPYATVYIEGTSSGTVCNAEGVYELDVT